ncbi:class I SAM-dependent methyltransferase [Streptomyces sp. NBS 14/10]|uniref:class I SAM-dependent methyltransferase n=1 Tax=Streptomyces sp. NBS 14/10 TaxID=1945643 RepID=UPI000B7D22C2|nr:class I SAM-dependent methyltransferase [Streptomyces sp. NBS 14/10]KAK1182843.1 class I SAM-dependent methyltransferase [Streptomyces sp. NBS 14/10]
MTATAPRAAQQPRTLHEVKGWFPSLDQVIFDRFLSRQKRLGQRGDLLEMGAYMGKSAIFTAGYLRVDERFTVCDLFDAPAPDERNAAEARKSYATLTRVAFEQNYLAFHDELPDVVQGPTSLVPDHVAADSCRFVHVDASHLYEHVAGDIDAAHTALVPTGVVVLDDFRSEHTPGVAAATWEAVFLRGLRPVCLTTQKLYGTWGDPEPLQEELLADEEWRAGTHLSVQEIAGQRVLRFSGRPPSPAAPRSRYAGEIRESDTRESDTAAAPSPQAPRAAGSAGSVPRRRSPVRKLAADVLPPVVTRAIRRRGGKQ